VEDKRKQNRLSTLELPFVYEEQGESKAALVKVVLCPRCVKKIMWKRNKEKEARQAPTEETRKSQEKADIYGPYQGDANDQQHTVMQLVGVSEPDSRSSAREEWQGRISRRRSRSRSPRRHDLSRSKHRESGTKH
jgi:protein FRA10AC1